MKRCPACVADVAGTWHRCPLCATTLESDGGEVAPEALAAPPLRFNRTQLRRVLLLLSLLLIAGSFGAQALIPQLMAPVRTVWLSLAVLWLVAIAVVQRRRNVGGLVGWLLVLLSLAAFVWNQYDGPPFWATTWAIPAICTAANIALGVVVWIVRLDASEHLAKAVMVVLIGMVPGLFVIFGWVVNPVPSLACVGLSLVLLTLMLIFRPRQVGAALLRRLHL